MAITRPCDNIFPLNLSGCKERIKFSTRHLWSKNARRVLQLIDPSVTESFTVYTPTQFLCSLYRK